MHLISLQQKPVPTQCTPCPPHIAHPVRHTLHTLSPTHCTRCPCYLLQVVTSIALMPKILSEAARAFGGEAESLARDVMACVDYSLALLSRKFIGRRNRLHSFVMCEGAKAEAEI